MDAVSSLERMDGATTTADFIGHFPNGL